MNIRSFDELTNMEIDTLREIGSIGTGNAATAMSTMLGREVRITLPEVRIMGYNEAIEWIGGPETVTAGVLVRMSGQLNGIMLAVQQLDFVNLVLESMTGSTIESYERLDTCASRRWWRWAISPFPPLSTPCPGCPACPWS